jgi:hypothetical protein
MAEMDDAESLRRDVIASHARIVKQAAANAGAQQSAASRRRRTYIVSLLSLLLLFGAWRCLQPRAPTLRSQAALAAATPLTAADASARASILITDNITARMPAT